MKRKESYLYIKDIIKFNDAVKENIKPNKLNIISFFSKGLLKCVLHSFVFFKFEMGFHKIYANGKSICEGRAKLDEKFNFKRTERMLFPRN